ncbi:MAG: PAS domain-containing protein [bacterium]|nr:PAS domain-containing protein [bacterium]
MSLYTIPNPNVIRQEILASHERCKQYGVDPRSTRYIEQPCLTPEELTVRREQNKDFLEIATSQIQELYRFVEGAGFAVTLVDYNGYVLNIIGDKPILERMRAGNCSPGYRWTERDVGTSVVSLVLERKIPIQVNDEEHFCERGHGFTCSASPVFNDVGDMIGVIAMSGEVSHVHPHTLGMVITAAMSIEKQMRIIKTSKELLLRHNSMTAIIDSIDSGVMAIDKHGFITQVNNKGKQILQKEEELEGQPLSLLLGSQVNVQQMMRAGFGYTDREVFIKCGQREVQVVNTAKPIFDAAGLVQGVIIVFNEIKRIRKLVNAMAGTQAKFTFENIIGHSPSLMKIRKLATQAASGSSSVLLLGETGTGKELFAQAIHNQSTRKHHPFMTINCGAIPRDLLESELFGYAGGAFTGAAKGGRPGKFELASGGTVFLDEIGDMPVDMQVKLLRVLQTGEVYRIGEHKPISVDIRVIAATHVSLKQEVERGNFRKDLFYRLNVFSLSIPPLRERSEDTLLLAKHILRRRRQALGKPRVIFSPESEQMLVSYHWPGNIRELENVVERAVNLVNGAVIEPEFFGLLIPTEKRSLVTENGGSLLEKIEKQTIMDVIVEVEFNVSKAAHILGITRATLYKKLKKYNIPIDRVTRQC